MQRRTIIALFVLVVAGVAWYLFRPEQLLINRRVSENLPATANAEANSTGADRVLLEGQFHDVSHKGSGQATVHHLADGKRLLRFTDFETSNGPDVRVYLVAAQDAADSETVKQRGFIELGPLKGNIGDQNYDLPEEVDLNKYRAVTIWCRRFGVNFATAPLMPRS